MAAPLDSTLRLVILKLVFIFLAEVDRCIYSVKLSNAGLGKQVGSLIHKLIQRQNQETGKTQARLLETRATIKVELLDQVQSPALILHSRGDLNVGMTPTESEF